MDVVVPQTVIPRRSGERAFRGAAIARACRLGPLRLCGALMLGTLLGGCWPSASAVTPVQLPAKDPNIIRVSTDQMHQVNVINVELYPFRVHKPAIGQIAFNEDASTVVQTPFSGRVTRVLVKIGDDVKRGDALFEIDSPKWCRRRPISSLRCMVSTRRSRK